MFRKIKLILDSFAINVFSMICQQKCSQGRKGLSRKSNEESKGLVLALWWFLGGHQAVIENRQYTWYRHFTTNNSCNLMACFLFQTILYIYAFSYLSSFLMHIFPVPKKKNLIVVFFTLVPLHVHRLFISLSLICISLSFITSLDEEKEQGRAKCWRTGESLEFIKNKWLLDNDLFNHKWALWAWSSEARREERERDRDKG